MIQQLVSRMMSSSNMQQDQAAAQILTADPFDLILHMEQVWDAANPWAPNPSPAGPARKALWASGQFNTYVPAPGSPPAWDHYGYSYALENTRAVQILRRVVREYRSGEGLGIPSVATQRWLDTTEALLFGAANPIAGWLSTSAIRQDAEAVRRNAYWRMFGLDLSFGNDDNRPPSYDRANAANTNFVTLFEELLYELWQAITNVRNTSGVNTTDDDRIYRTAQDLSFMLRSRRQFQLLAREELAAATVLGWIDLTLSADTPVVIDLKAQATCQADRLRNIGERVGLAPHSKSSAFFTMASDLSLVLRTIEAGLVSSPSLAWVLYLSQQPTTAPPGSPNPIGDEIKDAMTNWGTARNMNFKFAAKPIEVNRRRVVDARQAMTAR